MIAAVAFPRREIEDLAERAARDRLGIKADLGVASWSPDNGLELRFDEEPEVDTDDPWSD